MSPRPLNHNARGETTNRPTIELSKGSTSIGLTQRAPIAPVSAPRNSTVSPPQADKHSVRRGQRRRLFVANNELYYNAAFSGFVGGVNQAVAVQSIQASSYTALNAEAIQFAQAVDGAIPIDSGASQATADLLESIVANVIGGKYPTGLVSSQFNRLAMAIAAIFAETESSLYSITPPGSGPWAESTGLIYTTSSEEDTTSIQGGPGAQAAPSSLAAAFNNGIATGEQSFAAAGGVAQGTYDFAVGYGSVANGGRDIGSAAFCGGSTTADAAAAFGSSSLASGIGSFAASEGQATGPGSFVVVGGNDDSFMNCAIVGPYTAGNDSTYALGDASNSYIAVNYDGANGIEINPYDGATLSFGSISTQTTVGGDGGASPPPATPLGFFLVTLNGIGTVAVRYDNPF